MNVHAFPRKPVLAALALLILGALALGLRAAPTEAAIDKAGASHLKKIFERMLEEQGRQAAAQGGSIQTDGEVQVEPSDKYYAITLPHLLVKQPDGASVDIGMIAMNALPTDRKGQWKMTMALPTPILWRAPDGAKTVTIDIGRQNFAGIWHEAHGAYIKTQANYEDVRLTSSDGQGNLTIGTLKAVTDFNEAANGNWTGPAGFTVGNLQAGGPAGGFRVGTLEAQTNIYDYDMKAAKTYRGNVQALSESYKADGPGTSPQHAAGLYGLFTGFMGAVWDGFDSRVTMKDVQYDRASTAAVPARTIKMAEQSFNVSLKGFRQQAVALAFSAGYGGIQVTPPPTYAQTMPDNARIDLSVDRLPYKEIVELGRKAMESGTQGQGPQSGQALAVQTLMSLPQLMSQAGTTINLRDFRLSNAQYSAAGKGTLKADAQAAKGATGTGTMEIGGIERLIALVQGELKQPANAAPPQQERLNKLLTTLTLIQMLGQQAANAAGQPVRLYNFELTKDGKMMLNGTDLALLTQAGQQ